MRAYGRYRLPEVPGTREVLWRRARFVPHRGQRAATAAAEGKRLVFVTSGNRGGKSEWAGRYAVPVLWYDGSYVAIVPPVAEQGTYEYLYVTESYRRILVNQDGDAIRWPKDVYMPSQGRMECLLPSHQKGRMGATCKVRSAQTPRHLEGFSADLVIVAEAGLIPHDVVRSVLLQRIMDWNGQILLPFTPKGYNWAYELFCQAKEDPALDAAVVGPLPTSDNLDRAICYACQTELRLDDGLHPEPGWICPTPTQPPPRQVCRCGETWMEAEADEQGYPFVARTNGTRVGVTVEFIEHARRILPASMFRQNYGGEFVSLEGLVFPQFDPALHLVAEADVPWETLHTWPFYTITDFGCKAPFTTLWMTLSPDNVLYIYDEYAQSQRPFREHVLAMKDKEQGTPPSARKGYRVYEHDAQSLLELVTIGNELRYPMSGVLASKAKRDGIEACYDRLAISANGQVRLRVVKERCPNWVRQISTWCHTGRAEMAMSERVSDHDNDSMDCFCYGALESRKWKVPAQTTAPRIVNYQDRTRFRPARPVEPTLRTGTGIGLGNGRWGY